MVCQGSACVCVCGASSWIVLTGIKRHTRYPISFLAFFNLRKKKITEQVCSREPMLLGGARCSAATDHRGCLWTIVQ